MNIKEEGKLVPTVLSSPQGDAELVSALSGSHSSYLIDLSM